MIATDIFTHLTLLVKAYVAIPTKKAEIVPTTNTILTAELVASRIESELKTTIIAEGIREKTNEKTTPRN